MAKETVDGGVYPITTRDLSVDKWEKHYSSMTDSDLVREKSNYERCIEREILPHLRRSLKLKSSHDLENKTYLEIGCGPAFLACYLAKYGVYCLGVDVSMKGLKLASKLFRMSSVEGNFICADILHLPLAPNACDLIYGGGVIEHARGIQQAINELCRVLKPRGVAFNTVPYLSLGSITYRQIHGNIPDIPLVGSLMELFHLQLLKGKHMRFGYEKSFTASTLKRLFRLAGFRHVRLGLFDTYLPLMYIKNPRIKGVIRRIAKLRPFWPMIYVLSIK